MRAAGAEPYPEPMTAVVGLVHNRRVHIGADSAGVAGWSLTLRADEKVFRNGPYAMGFTTSYRMGQLLHHALVPPEPTGDLNGFMVTTFIDAVRTCLKDGGWATKSSEQESGGQFLVGVSGRLFIIDSDYQVAEPALGYAAVGCGADIALGALYATDGQPVRRRMKTALDAAERFSAGVQGPHAYVSTRKAVAA